MFSAFQVVLIYKKKFWQESATSIVLWHTRKQQIFEMSDGLRQQLHAERVDPKIIQEIALGLFEYDVLPSTNIPVLICWFSGSAALLIENFNEQIVGQVCHEVLCSYLNVPQANHQPVRILK